MAGMERLLLLLGLVCLTVLVVALAIRGVKAIALVSGRKRAREAARRRESALGRVLGDLAYEGKAQETHRQESLKRIAEEGPGIAATMVDELIADPGLSAHLPHGWLELLAQLGTAAAAPLADRLARLGTESRLGLVDMLSGLSDNLEGLPEALLARATLVNARSLGELLDRYPSDETTADSLGRLLGHIPKTAPGDGESRARVVATVLEGWYGFGFSMSPELLADCQKHSDPDLRAFVSRWARCETDDPGFLTMSRDPDERIRIAFLHKPIQGEKAGQRKLEMLADPAAAVRLEAIWSLASVPAVEDHERDRDDQPIFYWVAQRVLAKPLPEAVREAIAPLTQDGDATVTMMAGFALQAPGWEASVLGALESQDRRSRYHAARAVAASFGPKQLSPLFAQLHASRRHEDLQNIVDVLCPTTAEAVRPLLWLLERTTDAGVRTALGRPLGYDLCSCVPPVPELAKMVWPLTAREHHPVTRRLAFEILNSGCQVSMLEWRPFLTADEPQLNDLLWAILGRYCEGLTEAERSFLASLASSPQPSIAVCSARLLVADHSGNHLTGGVV
jgi:hypothetical protein